MIDAEDGDDIAALRERLHAAQHALTEAYDKRDALAEEAAAAQKTGGAVVPPELLIALGAAERAVLAAETEVKDAEHALAVAGGTTASARDKGPAS